MRRVCIALGAVLALGGCRTHRSAQAAEETATAARTVEVLSLDSVQEWLVVELDEPRITLMRDSVVELRASAARAARRVERGSTIAVAAADSSARHAAVTSEQTEAPPRKAWSGWWRLWLPVACAALIALSWQGIRLRR